MRFSVLWAVVALVVAAACMPAICAEEPGQDEAISAQVLQVSPEQREVLVAVGEQDELLVAVTENTVVQRYIYVTDLSDLRAGDYVTVYGKWDERRFIADRISITARGGSARPEGESAPRVDDAAVDSTILSPPSWFDRTLVLQTANGELRADVRKKATVLRQGRAVSVHDLKRGEAVRVWGRMDGRVLVADRVEVVEKPAEVPAPPDEEPAAPPETSTPAGQDDGTLTGRIVSVDAQNGRLVVDSQMRDVQVDASEAVVSRQGSSRRISDLKQGDRITIKGAAVEGGYKATEIEITD